MTRRPHAAGDHDEEAGMHDEVGAHDEVGVHDEGPEPRGRTLVLFGLALAMVIAAIIVGSALLAS
jgi:hypothetical protein